MRVLERKRGHVALEGLLPHRQRLVEDDAPGSRHEELVALAQADPLLELHDLALEREQDLVLRAEHPELGDGVALRHLAARRGEPVAAEDHVLGRGDHGVAVRRGQDVLRRHH